jgi:hypothetical protein
MLSTATAFPGAGLSPYSLPGTAPTAGFFDRRLDHKPYAAIDLGRIIGGRYTFAAPGIRVCH